MTPSTTTVPLVEHTAAPSLDKGASTVPVANSANPASQPSSSSSSSCSSSSSSHDSGSSATMISPASSALANSLLSEPINVVTPHSGTPVPVVLESEESMQVDIDSELVKGGGERRDSNAANLARLSVHSRSHSSEVVSDVQDPAPAVEVGQESQASAGATLAMEIQPGPHAKSRRASTLSSTSSSESAATDAWASPRHPMSGLHSLADPRGEITDGGRRREKGTNDPTKPARRKAARTISAEGMLAGSGRPEIHERLESSQQEQPPPRIHTITSPTSAAAFHHSLSTSTTLTHPPLSLSSHEPATSAATPPTTTHVDIVTYPSADLLRLLAALLEQIARANDALHQRNSEASSRMASGRNTPARTGASPTAEDGRRVASGLGGEEQEQESKGRFDAAPLNSPASPRWQEQHRQSIQRETGAMDLDYTSPQHTPPSQSVVGDALEEMLAAGYELPVTPGVDLLREVGQGGGAEGFMPSLGGAHTPMPLARRRGNSFLKLKTNEQFVASQPPVSASTSAFPSPSSSNTNSYPFPSHDSNPGNNETLLTSLLTASALALASPSATLCFHARNIPAITVEAYLLRILKYCPTTNEVFLSLLVYFDRMARVGLEAQRVATEARAAGVEPPRWGDESEQGVPRLFSIDSFNIHRLIIAGVTVASKFFSDVFYTNSRYAKVGGLPLNELNQLELQFLLLNDFRLVIPVDELQRYADQLILFWTGRDSTQPLFVPELPSLDAVSAPMVHPTTPPTSVQQHPARVFGHDESIAAGTASQGATTPTSLQYRAGSLGTAEERPSSIRSAPSSSGTSVTSTITPGSPSTPTAAEDEERRQSNTLADEQWRDGETSRVERAGAMMED